jgi:hypothetical protein
LIPDVSPNLSFDYEVMNFGEPYEEKVFKIIFDLQSDAAAGILNAVMQGRNFDTLNDFAHKIHDLGGCDGPVAVDAKLILNKPDPNLLNVPTLDTLTRDTGRYQVESRIFDEFDSQPGCGRSSRYKVTWSLIRTSWQK